MIRVITYGTFDLFHEGHYNILKRAKQLGDYLIVGVTTDEYDQARGKLNVVDSLMTRIENVKQTGFADEIIVEASSGQKFKDIQKYDIDIFAIGSDWMGMFDYLENYCKVVYLERTKNISSTLLRLRETPIQRIGIIGTGRIADRFMPEATLVSGVNAQCVYNPHMESAERFAKRWGIDACRSPEEFYKFADIVYIASPHETHYFYIKQALEHGKHVLCEKPLCLHPAQAQELFQYAKEKDLILAEGIKTAYCPGFMKLLGIACSGIIGSIRNIEACFTKLADSNSRELQVSEFSGSFIELGSYCLLPIIKIFGQNYEEIRFDMIKNEEGVDIFTKAYIKYSSGLATATCGLGVKSEGKLLISGTLGYIVVEAPWWKTSYFEVHHEDPNDVERFSERFLGEGLRYELCDLLSMINGDIRRDFKLTKGDSVAIAGIMEKFMKEQKRI
ncbi:MAG: Gfo/Idh/MocA family oxidoreductase [Ruminococcus sp.]|nr:Gfo/Idh/MocA family oxidoreductase [Ruminococcus sp.]